MSLKPDDNCSAEDSAALQETGTQSASVISDEACQKALRKSRRMVLTAALATLFTLTVLVAGSIAWLANNRQVQAVNTVGSVKGPASLYIEAGNLTAKEGYQSKYKYTTSVVTSAMSGDLYPISLWLASGNNAMSGARWWYASGWTKSKCTAYTEANVSQNTASGKTDQYIYTAGGSSHTAYNVASYTLYCNAGNSMNVYFDGANPFTVSTSTDSSQNPKYLASAIRIGFVVDGTLKFVYAATEDGKGNSSGAESDYYMVDSGSTIATPTYTIVNNVNDYSASADDGIYSGSDKPLCRTDYNGTVLSVYVWLEGTDAQAILGQSDSASGISFDINLVGIEK